MLHPSVGAHRRVERTPGVTPDPRVRSDTRFEERSAFERLVVPGAHGTGASITYQPGLDGLRGLAVGVVVLFHLGIGAVGGGFLAVSLFFTLSGVLIGTLMLAELDSTGRFDLRALLGATRPSPAAGRVGGARRAVGDPPVDRHAVGYVGR